MATESNDVVTTVRKSYDAYFSRKRDVAEALMADNFRFTSPYDDGIDREAFFSRCWPGGDNVSEFRIERMVPDGDSAYVTYLFTRKDGTASRNTEYVTVANGQVTHVEVFFGANFANGRFVSQEPAKS